MLKINDLAINIQIENGHRTFRNKFYDGVNVITSSMNTSGKSAIINAILYCLGMEELIGGIKGHKSLSTAFHNKIWDEAGEGSELRETYKVLFSTIYLEISNGTENITLKRHANNPDIDDSLITIYFSKYDSIGDSKTQYQNYYVNSKGSAKNSKGFLFFLENFLSADLPIVPKFKGQPSKLYFQNIFGAMFIEQKRGWSDVLARVPNYGIIDVKQRVVEYLLKLETLENEKKKSEIKNEIERIKTEWKILYTEFQSKSFPFYISELPSEAMVIGEDLIENQLIRLIAEDGNKNVVTIDEYIKKEKKEKDSIDSKLFIKGNDIHNLSHENQKIENQLSELNSRRQKIKFRSDLIKSEIDEYLISRDAISEDIQNNKDLKKLKKLGADENISVLGNACPVCHQDINDSLLDSQQNVQVMSIDENITYLTSQLKLFDNLIFQKRNMEKETIRLLEEIDSKEATLFSLMRAIKDDIYSVSEAYSENNIEKKIVMKLDIEEKEKLKTKFDEVLKNFISLSDKLKGEYLKIKELPENRLSILDEKKLNEFSKSFVSYLETFDYRSVSNLNEVKISRDTYIPEADGFDLKSDSSASDNIRTIWAYTMSLMKVSNIYKGNHLGLIIFDEPKQHSIHEKDIIEFFNQAMLFQNNQIIIGFTQDQLESPQVFLENLREKGCNIINLGTKAFK
ncbi:hypothetical protein OGZ39_11985 [Lactococcus lactis]|uniref:Uncharacterized protein n=1 Tax=Lactococcus lactis TaxID=1358 RepID=A0A9X4S3P6_9LACT|nr:hypothetical protein [Lactococcus lactis]MDG4982357.1 hypothetical protein [Lactococcus lactis]THA51330.1 hypothetical protein E5555_11090 [Lactococcus lactis]